MCDAMIIESLHLGLISDAVLLSLKRIIIIIVMIIMMLCKNKSYFSTLETTSKYFGGAN